MAEETIRNLKIPLFKKFENFWQIFATAIYANTTKKYIYIVPTYFIGSPLNFIHDLRLLVSTMEMTKI